MTAAESSLVGFAKQVAGGTPNVTDADYKYILFSQGGMAPNNVTLPLDQEVGGGAMLRDVKKVGVYSVGQFDFIPRPDSLGIFLLGALGLDTPTPKGIAPNDYQSHAFTLDTDQFAAPYYTVRVAPGMIWGDQFNDCRISGLSLSWRASNFLRGSVSVIGGLPLISATAPSAWTPTAAIGGPQFISSVSDIELPTLTDVKCLAGSFTAGLAIPMDDQWIVGSFTPDAFDINSRAFAVTMTLKLVDASLYTKMMYDPAAGSAWVSSLFREGGFKLEFNSDATIPTIDPTLPYQLTIAANDTNDNVVWSASPVGLRAGRQIIMNVTGLFLADAAPLTVTLLTAKDIDF